MIYAKDIKYTLYTFHFIKSKCIGDKMRLCKIMSCVLNISLEMRLYLQKLIFSLPSLLPYA